MVISFSKSLPIENSLLRCLVGQPLSWGYGAITALRNRLYDTAWIPSISFPIPIFCIGNLSLGGTGKTPHTEYLIRLLKENCKVAVLSRGYKRKSSGFLWADSASTAADIGDEPLQYFKKFGHEISVAVDNNRVRGVKGLMRMAIPEVVLLDDGFQHRRLRASYNILLTDHDHLYCDDRLLPLGTLREDKTNAKRADLIIVTKCPENLSEKHQGEIIKKLQPEKAQQVFFSSIRYADILQSRCNPLSIGELKEKQVLLVTGIAHARPLRKFLESKAFDVIHLNYPDHHAFTIEDYSYIHERFIQIPISKVIVTSEKDYMRMDLSQLKGLPVFYLPISVQINQQKEFNEKNFTPCCHNSNKPPNTSKAKSRNGLTSPSCWVLD